MKEYFCKGCKVVINANDGEGCPDCGGELPYVWVGTMNAQERGMELLGTNGMDVPLLALRYQKALCGQVGKCIEVMLTALCWYAETEEGLEPGSDDLYVVHNDEATMKVIEEANADDWKPEWWDEILRTGEKL